MSWENRTVGQPCATQLKTKHDNMKAHGQTRDGYEYMTVMIGHENAAFEEVPET